MNLINNLRNKLGLEKLEIKEFESSLIDGELLVNIIKFWKNNKIFGEIKSLKEDWERYIGKKSFYPSKTFLEVKNLILEYDYESAVLGEAAEVESN